MEGCRDNWRNWNIFYATWKRRPIQKFGPIAYSNYKWRILINSDRMKEELLPIRRQDVTKKVTTTIFTYPRMRIETSFTYLQTPLKPKKIDFNRPLYCTRYFMVKFLFWKYLCSDMMRWNVRTDFRLKQKYYSFFLEIFVKKAKKLFASLS